MSSPSKKGTHKGVTIGDKTKTTRSTATLLDLSGSVIKCTVDKSQRRRLYIHSFSVCILGWHKNLLWSFVSTVHVKQPCKLLGYNHPGSSRLAVAKENPKKHQNLPAMLSLAYATSDNVAAVAVYIVCQSKDVCITAPILLSTLKLYR